MRLIVVVQLLAIVAFGLVTVFRFEIWSPIDERAHFGYVESIAVQHQLPTVVRGQPISQARNQHTYEAFEPPLYYVLAAPAFAVSPGGKARVFAVRSFDLLLYLAAVFVFSRLVRTVFGTGYIHPLAFGLVFFLVPGVLVRCITVSYTPLALLLSLVFVTLLMRAHQARGAASSRYLLAAGVVLGLALLTHLLLAFLVPVYLFALGRRFWRRRTWKQLLPLATFAVIPLLLLSPWLAFNRAHYGAFTANAIARDMQKGIVNPTNHDYGVRDAARSIATWPDGLVVPDEWGVYYGRISVLPQVRRLLVAVFFVVPLLLLVTRPRMARTRHLVLLGSLMGLNMALLITAQTFSDWRFAEGRYLVSAAGPWMLFAFLAYRGVLRRAPALLPVTLFGTASVLIFWLEIGPRYF
jgi:4-amino-4-deoxy-L-arabinose transferase-like glycosyltransferase